MLLRPPPQPPASKPVSSEVPASKSAFLWTSVLPGLRLSCPGGIPRSPLRGTSVLPFQVPKVGASVPNPVISPNPCFSTPHSQDSAAHLSDSVESICVFVHAAPCLTFSPVSHPYDNFIVSVDNPYRPGLSSTGPYSHQPPSPSQKLESCHQKRCHVMSQSSWKRPCVQPRTGDIFSARLR